MRLAPVPDSDAHRASYWHQDCMNANDRHYLAVEFTHQFGVQTVQYSTTVDTEQVPDRRLATSPTREKYTRLSGQLRRAFSFLTMLAFLLVTLEFIMTRGSVLDPDIWWHLRNAEYLFQHHQLPRADMYSFTVAGHPWINHEWLAEIPYYLAWRAGGLSGINAMMFATISLITAAGFVQGSWGRVDAERWTPSQMGKLVVTGLASVAALFVNPFGSRLVFYPLDMAFRQKLNISHIAEWVSVDFHDLRGKFVLALLLTLLVTALLRRTRWQLAEVGVVLFALYSGLTYIRFLFLLAIVIAPVLARILDFVPRYRPQADTPIINALVICVMAGSVVHYWPSSSEMEKSVSEKYPTRAISFLKAHPPNGRVLNFYMWGGYLGWNDREFKVFIDSRVDIFEYAGVLKDYLDMLELERSKAVLANYDMRYVLFPHRGEYRESPLTFTLQHDPEWKTIYSDDLTILLGKSGTSPTIAAPAAQEWTGYSMRPRAE